MKQIPLPSAFSIRPVIPAIGLAVASMVWSVQGRAETPVERTGRFSVVMMPAKYAGMEMTLPAPGFFEFDSLDAWTAEMKEIHLK